jgi:hypothetical protein
VETLQFPFDPRVVGETAMSGDGAFNGTRLAEEFLTRLERAADGQAFVALAQAAASTPQAGRAIREFLATRIMIAPEAEPGMPWGRRHSMVASALVGTAWTRWVLGIEPLASASPAEVARWIGPTLDHYATSTSFSDEEPLGGAARRRARMDAMEHERDG